MRKQTPVSRPALILMLLLTANVAADLSRSASLGDAPYRAPFALTTANVLRLAEGSANVTQGATSSSMASDDGEDRDHAFAMHALHEHESGVHHNDPRDDRAYERDSDDSFEVHAAHERRELGHEVARDR